MKVSIQKEFNGCLVKVEMDLKLKDDEILIYPKGAGDVKAIPAIDYAISTLEEVGLRTISGSKPALNEANKEETEFPKPIIVETTDPLTGEKVDELHIGGMSMRWQWRKK